MMKTFFLVAFFLFGFASAKPKPAKRALSCKAFPAKLSGRLYMVTVTGSGGTSKLEITFNMDSEREIAHLATQYAGTEINMIQDYKGGKTYTIYPQGCYSSPLEGKLFPPEQLKGLLFERGGKLGLNGVKPTGFLLSRIAKCAYQSALVQRNRDLPPLEAKASILKSFRSQKIVMLRRSVDPFQTCYIQTIFIPRAAKTKPAKRELKCDFPKKLSGRLYMVNVTESGGTSKWEMTYNMDSELEKMQTLTTFNGVEYNTIWDFKMGKAYTVYSGRCFVSPIEDDDVFNSEELKSLTFDTKGKLGMKGTVVGVYGGIVNGGNSATYAYQSVLIQRNRDLPPLEAAKLIHNCFFAFRFFDLKTSLDPKKFKIPEHCSESSPMQHRSPPDMIHPYRIHTANLQAAIKRGFAWLLPKRDQKMGFSWSHLQRKGYP
ncbi:hypothetical protein pdam_00003806 [Pocillopora damicornis]|uniref:Uncharacterized protein n=1 Tax=Pocillopora damicornis TaxID=46731 RepID=A0A3M6T4H4_POCDA|nr:hypothetical protein pdam_00003806 [Pocillopora damicornis]